MEKHTQDRHPKITVTENGPYLVSGNVPLTKQTIKVDGENIPESWGDGEHYPIKSSYALCRCGESQNKPYCDSSHIPSGFDGTETAGNVPFGKTAEITTGPELVLKDEIKLCASARFCYRAGDTWTLTEKSNEPQAKAMAIQEVADCPSGRLVVCDKATGKPIEPVFTPEISVTEDPSQHVSGPLWVKGGIPVVSADGKPYEVRNRVTLCRCGKSENKPFCDATHVDIHFNDGDASLKS